MGMSASQARLLGLQARQSNLEYQGQQINQERTILSQQCTALYNSLLAMQVPTPPSTQDYTTIEYSGVDGATNFTLGTVKPSGENYNVEIKTTHTGNALQSDYGSKVVGKAGETMKGSYVPTTVSTPTGNFNRLPGSSEYREGDIYLNEKDGVLGNAVSQGAKIEDYMVLDSDTGVYTQAAGEFDPSKTYYKKTSKADYDKLEEAGRADYAHLREDVETSGVTIKADELSIYYVKNGDTVSQLSANSPYVDKNKDGTFTLKALPAGATLFQKGNGSDELNNPNAGATTVGGNVVYTFEDAKKEFPQFSWSGYEEAIKNSFGTSSESLDADDFYVYIETNDSGVQSVKFTLRSDVGENGQINDGFAKTYSFTPNGSFTSSTPTDGCKLEFDTQGRITKISIPQTDTEGKITGYRDIELKAAKVTDEAAYHDAMNEYEYAQYEYDKAQQEINAKTEVIQQEDRNLELKLQRLDNERTQITTEIEAVEKVIQENIEKSYKTFSG
ncbi:DUF4200 domain-containing protein [bacterium]|nr:DUF4200 domain-containing protein [bacterium]